MALERRVANACNARERFIRKLAMPGDVRWLIAIASQQL
jgi:hypothetical protein